MINFGVNVITDENGNIVEEKLIIIEDGATTAIKSKRHYDIGWIVNTY